MEILTARKVKGRIKKLQPDYEFYLKDIRINGVLRGCSGFVRNPSNDSIIYVNTEGSSYSPLSNKFMYRAAKSLKDYTGGINRWALKDDVAGPIISLLDKGTNPVDWGCSND